MRTETKADQKISWTTRGLLRFGFISEFTPEQLKDAYDLVLHASDSNSNGATGLKVSSSALGGRGVVYGGAINGMGPVVLKSYHRGGWLKHLIQHRHVRLGRSRPQREFEMLNRVRSLGVHAPKPLAIVERGSLLYNGWLITSEILNHEPLIEVCQRDEDSVPRLLEETVSQISTLIENNIFHIDLHPGNVVVGGDGRVYILDFDKACEFFGGRNELRDRYLRRWRRAVIKHGLPDILSEGVCLGLRNHYE